MREFTFVIFSYNQEKFILEHLESIKYQIEHFADGINCKFILADDKSTDRTVDLVKIWLQENKKLFSDAKVLDSTSNMGVVKNYIRCLENVTTNYYKVLAGDDLYYNNNIFEIKNEFNITPVLRFNENGLVRREREELRHKRMLINRENISGFLKEILENENYIDAPGIFFQRILIDKKLISYLQKYTWCEDLPTWWYLFKNRQFKVSVFEKPYIMYRSDVGVSSNKQHTKRDAYLEDEQRLRKDIFTNKLGRRMIYKWKTSLFKRLCKYYYDKNAAAINGFDNNMAQAEKTSKTYLELIRKNVEEFKSKNKLVL